MNKDRLFWQWAGYLSSPFRRTVIHAEIHPSKEKEFREHYFKLTKEPILLTGKASPFYVWDDDVNKYGKQLRVYFDGSIGSTPKAPNPFRITKGRKAGGLRINGNEFVFNLFQVGFVLGRNVHDFKNIEVNVPLKFKTDFKTGFYMTSPVEKMEILVLNHCTRKGILMEKTGNLQNLWKDKNINASVLLDKLCKNKTLIKKNKQNVYALLNIEKLRGEIESRSIQKVIDIESDNNKREILMETYVRDRGWIRLAKNTFGDVCMVEKCQNTFRKDNGERYIETHHIKSLSDGGKDHIYNLALLCAHHHRMAHFSEQKKRDNLRSYLQQRNKGYLKNLGLL